MSMIDDVFGLNRTNVMESTHGFELEPELVDLEESVGTLDDYEDPFTYMVKVAYENEINMQTINSAILREEYVYLRENGQELVYEQGKIKNIIDTAIKSIKWLAEKVTKFFKTVVGKLTVNGKKDAEFAKRYTDKVANVDKVTIPDAKFEVGYIAKNRDYINAIMKNLRGLSEKIIALETDSAEQVIKSMDSQIKTIFDAKSISEVSDKHINTKLGMFEKPKDVTVNTGFVFGYIENASSSIDAVKSVYNNIIGTFNGEIKLLKSQQKNSKNDNEAKVIHAKISAINKVNSLITRVYKAGVSLIITNRTLCKAAIIKAAKEVNEKNSKNESAWITGNSLMDFVSFSDI